MGFGRRIGVVLVALLGASALLSLSSMAQGETSGNAVDKDSAGAPYAAGELIVVYKESASDRAVQSVDGEAGARTKDDLPALHAKLIEFPEIESERSQDTRERDLRDAKAGIERNPAVKDVYYNYVRTASFTPDDPKFKHQYGLKKPDFDDAWNRTRGLHTRVAIVDSGADLKHPDLRKKAVAQRDFVNNDDTVEDLFGHGTHVAGIAAARTDNGTGVAGGCPYCRLIIAKALDKDGVGYDSDIANAIMWSADQGAKAINLSLGNPAPDSILKQAIDYATSKGAVVIAAAGNNEADGSDYPAAYGNVIAVAATGPNDGRDNSYDHGDYIDVSAPGLDIISTVPGGGYAYYSGTSMATAHVTALAGLLAAQGRGPKAIRHRIMRTTVDLGPAGRDPYYGTGRIDADRATRK